MANFICLSKDRPAGIQTYLYDEDLTTESAAEAATAGNTTIRKNGNIITDKNMSHSYSYQNGWKAIDTGSSNAYYENRIRELEAENEKLKAIINSMR